MRSRGRLSPVREVQGDHEPAPHLREALKGSKIVTGKLSDQEEIHYAYLRV